MDYLNSSKAVEDYTTLALKFGGNGKQFNKAWKESLEDKGIVTQDVNEDDILPKKLIAPIAAAIDASPVLSALKITYNVEAGSIAIEPVNTVGALGHKSGATKTVQQTTLTTRDLVPKAIYKLQKLDHMTFLKGGALVKWVMTELPLYVVQRLAQAVLVGGVKNEDGSDFTAVRAIVGDSLANTTELAAAATSDDVFSAIMDALTNTRSVVGNRILFIRPDTYNKLLHVGDGLGTAIFTGMGQLPASKIVVVSDADVPGMPAFIVLDADSYLLGFAGSGVETLGAFEIMTNSQVIESRAYVFGTLTRAGAATVATVPAP